MNNSRIITVFSTKGKQKSKIETDVITWGALQPFLMEEGYDLENLLATENINRRDLLSVDAELPEGEFTVFLRPQKTKSGTDVSYMSFTEMRQVVKNNHENKDFLDHMGNYTRMNTETLRETLTDWFEFNLEPDCVCKDVKSFTINDQMIDLIDKLAKVVTNNGVYIVKVIIEEVCNEDCMETKALVIEAEDILKGYN
jgi:hypothetical protein